MILHYSDFPEQPWPALEAALAGRLPAARARAIGRKGTAAARNASLLGLLLLESAARALGMPCRLEALEALAHGKPALPGLGDFSISHAGTCVACAIAEAGLVGLDLEPAGRVAAASLRLVASAAERGAHDPTALFVRKEAVVKAAGATIAALGEVRLEGARARLRGVDYELQSADLGPGYVAALAHSAPAHPVEPRYLPGAELLRAAAASR